MKRPLRENLNEKALNIVGIPRNLRDKTIDDFDTFGIFEMQVIKDFINNYVSDLHKRFLNCEGIFFYGSNGQGKTLLSSLILIEAYRNRYSCKRVTFSTYVSKYTRLWKVPSYEIFIEQENFNTNYLNVEFLVLEEIGKEVDTKITAPILEELLRYREDEGLPTIICTNLSLKVMEDRYGASISSLIKGNMTPIKISGEDKRLTYYNKRIGDNSNDE